MSTHNIGFYKDLTKIIFQLSSNTLTYLNSTEIQLVFKTIHYDYTPMQHAAIFTVVKLTIF